MSTPRILCMCDLSMAPEAAEALRAVGQLDCREPDQRVRVARPQPVQPARLVDLHDLVLQIGDERAQRRQPVRPAGRVVRRPGCHAEM